jgi:hypothetical protein
MYADGNQSEAEYIGETLVTLKGKARRGFIRRASKNCACN